MIVFIQMNYTHFGEKNIVSAYTKPIESMKKSLLLQVVKALLLCFCYLFITPATTNLYAQCTGCSFSAPTDGTNFNFTNNQVLCITANTTNLSWNMNGANSKICVAPNVTWTQSSGGNFSGNVTIDVYGTFIMNGNYNVNGNTIINVHPTGILTRDDGGLGSKVTINNEGTVNFNSANTINFQDTFVFNNLSGATLNAPNTINFFIGNGANFTNDGMMKLANAENSEGFITNSATGSFIVARSFYNHGNFINNGDYQLPCNTLSGAANATTCSFKVGDKGAGKQFINNKCMKVTGDVIFDGFATLNGVLEIASGYDVTINKTVTGTGGSILLKGGISTISSSGSYIGTEMKFYDVNTTSHDFDVKQGNTPSNYTLSAISCTETVVCTKPNAGADQTLVCAGITPSTTTNLVAASTGTQWIAKTGNPSNATVNATSGVVDGMTAYGDYVFILKTIGDNTCADTVKVTRRIQPDAGANITICSPESTTKINAAANGQKWTQYVGNPLPVTIENDGTVKGISAVGAYTFTLTEGSCSAEVQILKKEKPDAGKDIVLCAPATIAKLKPLLSEGQLWTVIATPSSTAFPTVDAEGNITGLVNNGIYTFVLIQNECTDTVKVIRNAAPTLTVTSTNPCIGQGTSLQAITDATSYTWTGPSNFVTTQQNPTLGNISTANLGTYTVTVIGKEGCTNSATTVVTLGTTPTVSATNNSPVCVGSNVTLSANSNGSSFSWTGNGYTSTQQNPVLKTTNTSNGIYTVMVTNLAGCTATATTLVQLSPNPIVTPSATTPICVGQRLELSVTGTAGTTYAWSSSTGFTTTMQNPFTLKTTLAEAGVWSVVAENKDGCKATGTINVVVNPLPEILNISASQACVNAQVALAVVVDDVFQYEWTGGGSFTSSIQNPMIPVSTAGVYNFMVKGTNKFGCITTATVSTTVFANPTVTLASANVCIGEKITLNAQSNGTEFSWVGPNIFTSSEKSPQINPTSIIYAGVYSVKVSNANSCTATATTLVVVNSKPQAGNDMSICAPVSTAQLTINAGLSWTAEATNPVVATIDKNTGKVTGMSQNGIYVFYLTNDAGCKDTLNIYRNAQLDAGNDIIICDPKTTAKLLALNNGQTWKYLADASLPTPTINSLGEVSGLTKNGKYLFVLQQQAETLCADTVAIVRAGAPNAGGDQTGRSAICEPASTAKLQAVSLGQKWVVVANNPAGASINNSGEITGMTVNGIYTFLLQQGECIDSVKVERAPKPNGGNDYTICADSTSYKLPNALSNTTWSVLGNNPSNASINPTSGAVSNMTAIGNYRFVLTNTAGCTDTVTVRRMANPTFQATAVKATCLAATVEANAQIVLTNFDLTNKYDVSEGKKYVGNKNFDTAKALPNNGIITNTLKNPTTDIYYTIRVFNENNCYTDNVVHLTQTVCACKPTICVPYIVVRIAKNDSK